MTTTIINCVCPRCTKVQNVVVPTQGHADWLAGELIQYAMPELSPDERAALITGICPTCWDNIFSAAEDDSDDWEDGDDSDEWMGFEDDGQPTEYEEWQDLYEGDDDYYSGYRGLGDD